MENIPVPSPKIDEVINESEKENGINVCTLKNNLSYEFSQCDPDTQTRNVFFYYDSDLMCHMAESDPLPGIIYGVECDHVCPEHG